MIQLARAVFNGSLCILEFSILVKMLHIIFGHNTDYYVIFSGVLFCQMPSSNCFALFAEGQVSSMHIMRSSETVPQEAHRKFVIVLRL